MRQACASFLLVLTALALQPTPADAQVISVNPLSHDFGQMEQQETQTINVTVTNEGAAQLKIEDVKASCGCTIPALDRDTLGPGESTEIEIIFNSKKMTGQVIKSVVISSNDPNNPQVEFMIMADIHAQLVIDPVSQRVGFSRSLQGEVLTRNVTFTAMDQPQLEISADKTRKGLFDVSVINGHEGNQQVSLLEVTVPADMEIGRHRDHVRVNTNIESMPTIDIEMQAWIIQALVTSPEQISFRYKKDFKQTVRVSPFEEGTEYKVTSAEIDLPEISVTVQEVIPNVQTNVILEGKPISKSEPRAQKTKGQIKGTLLIYTDHPDTPVIKIPVTYMVRL